MTDRTGQVAVVFLSQRRAGDDDAYGAAAAAMEALAAGQAGYRGVDSARGADGFGITISWWADEAAAVAWRRHPVHAAIRDAGRADWYERYEVAVAGVDRVSVGAGWSVRIEVGCYPDPRRRPGPSRVKVCDVSRRPSQLDPGLRRGTM